MSHQTGKVTIYSKTPCAYCVSAQRMLDNKGVSYEIIDLTDQPEKIQEMKTQFGWMTIPIIVINDQLIGGYNDLKALEQDGQLDSLLGI